MDVRDAVEADAERLADLTGSPTDVMRNLVHDRTVRVAVESTTVGDSKEGTWEAENDRVLGFVSFDAQRQTVHITQMEGPESVARRLLEEPRRFAANEEMSVELLVPDENGRHQSVAEAVGFEKKGPGPRFGGAGTIRYRLDP
jgi:hypothetical protein